MGARHFSHEQTNSPSPLLYHPSEAQKISHLVDPKYKIADNFASVQHFVLQRIKQSPG